MHFNPNKCEVIRITTKRNIITSSYFIHGKELNITSKGKYLGITISQNLSWNNHIDNVCRKANNTTAFLRRNLSSCPANIRTKFHNRIVDGKKDSLCTVVLLYGTIYFCCCPLVSAPRWCMNGGGSVATGPLIIRYIIIALVLKRRCWSVSQFRWFSIVVALLVVL
jgi:hypothetical protein